MTKNDNIRRVDKRIVALEKENVALKKENEALNEQLAFARGLPAVNYVADLTEGTLTKYKDRYDVRTKNGNCLEVKWSHLNAPNPSKTRRWNWESILGMNQTKLYDFLVLTGKKDSRYEAQYPIELPWVFFLVPFGDVFKIMSKGYRVALNTNLATSRTYNSTLRTFLVRSTQQFKNL